jgi:hypothetical protein
MHGTKSLKKSYLVKIFFYASTALVVVGLPLLLVDVLRSTDIKQADE